MPVLPRRRDPRGDAADQLQRREDERGAPGRAGLGQMVDQPLGVESEFGNLIWPTSAI